MSATVDAGQGGFRQPASRPPRPDGAGASDVWPLSAMRVDGALTVGGVDVRDIAAEFGTPVYVLDEDDFRSRCREFREAFADADVYYAGKAFLCKALARWVAEEGLGLDVCTGGELAVARAAGFPPERIAFHGNNKSLDELGRALDAGVGRIVVDSFQEVARLAFLADERGLSARVLLRVTTGVEAHTHEYIATAHDDQKFGFALSSGVAAEAVRHVRALRSLELVGLHSHIGSQIFDTAGFEVAAHRMVGLLREVRDEHGVELPELNLGGGLGVAHVPGEDPLDVKVLADNLRTIVSRECTAAGLAVPRLALEPGRAIVGPAGISVYEVGTLKEVETSRSGEPTSEPEWSASGGEPPAERARRGARPVTRTYVSVDGGMSDNIRTPLYGATYTCTLASRESGADPMLSRVVGKHCENGDVVVRDTHLPGDLAPGDLVAVATTGAYSRALASNYNHVPRPAVVAVADGRARTIVRAETEQDLLRLDAE